MVKKLNQALPIDVVTGAPVISDYDENGFVSMYEAQKYIIENCLFQNTPLYEDDNDGVGVSLGIETGIGVSTFL